MDRRAYVRRQRDAFGRRSLAVLPVHHPKPLLTALDLLAVELWGPPGPPRSDAAGRLQTYVCAVARNALAFLAGGHADVVDGALFPHTCDALQGLATLATDLGGWSKPAFTFQHPRGDDRPSARAYVRAELRSLAGALAPLAGRAVDDGRLAWALRLHADIDAARAALLGGRARLRMTDPELYAVLRRGEWLWPEEHLAELRAAAAALAPAPVQEGVPVLVTGYVPEPAGILAALNDAGAYVAADDYAAVGRRIPRPPLDSGRASAAYARGERDVKEGSATQARPLSPTGGEGRGEGAPRDPWAALVDWYFSFPPCPTRGPDQAARMRHLVSLAERSGARGVLVHVQKFCEPELFDVPAIRRTFEARGLPVVVVEGELERELSAQAATRVEAFAEMLRAGGRAA